MKVPEWKGYFPQLQRNSSDDQITLDINPNVATNEQQAFYVYWLDEFKKGNPLDVEGNIAYIFCYLYEHVYHFISTEDIELMKLNFERVLDAYGEYEKIKQYCFEWLSEAYILKNDFATAWNYAYLKKTEHNILFNKIYNFKRKCSDISITADVVYSLTGFKSILEKHINEDDIETFSVFLDKYFDDFEKQHRVDIVSYYISKFDFWNMNEESLEQYRSLFKDRKKFNHKLLNYGLAKKRRESDLRSDYHKKYVDMRNLFGGLPTLLLDDRLNIVYIWIPEIIEAILKRQFRSFLVELFNKQSNNIKLKFEKF